MNPKKIYLSRFRRAIPFAFPNKRSLTRQLTCLKQHISQMVPILLLHCLLMRPLPVPQQKVHLKPIRLIVPAAVNYIPSLLPLLSKSTAAPV